MYGKVKQPTMENTIERAQIASGKRAFLYGPKGVEHSLFTGNKTTNETRIASTIRRAQENIIATAQGAAGDYETGLKAKKLLSPIVSHGKSHQALSVQQITQQRRQQVLLAMCA